MILDTRVKHLFLSDREGRSFFEEIIYNYKKKESSNAFLEIQNSDSVLEIWKRF